MDEQRKAWTKQDGEDASRLLAEMVKRAKDASGGVRPEQIPTGSVRVPARADEADGGQSQGVAANCNHRPHYVAGGHDGEGQAATDKALSSPIARRNPAPDGVEGPLSRGSK